MEPHDSRLRGWISPVVHLSSNFISLAGVVLATIGGVSWLFLLPQLVHSTSQNPYIGLFWLADLGVFLLGLVLIPLGMYFRWRALKEQGVTDARALPPLTLQSPEVRKLLGFILVATTANVVIASQLTYSGIQYMDKQEFCGQVCHTVMQPEFVAYQQSPHAHVSCVECHIGPGAAWFIRYKVTGLGQLVAVATDSYPRPIPAPVANLRPAQDTCAQCHWPQRFIGDKMIVHTGYSGDEQNSPATTVLLMKVGGRAWNGPVGIHGAHLAGNTRIEYIAADAKRQTIPQVIYTDANGKQTVYNDSSSKVTADQLARGERRTMDCVDCHNRSGHIFQLPERALDDGMANGGISPALPYIKKQALAALKADYPDRATAQRRIAAALDAFYQQNYPQIYSGDRARVDTAVAAVQAIYARNVFPEMKVTWGTYPDNLGHMDSPGCFRCHDGSHTSADGRAIPNDCNTCHNLVAMEEKNPKILGDLGLAPAQTGGGSK